MIHTYTGMCWWSIEKMRTNSWRFSDHWEVSCSTIRRLLRSVLHTGKNLAVWILLANDVWRHQRVYLKVSKMSAAGQYQRSQCNAPPLQPPDRSLWCLGHWLHGTLPEVHGVRVHPHRCWLHVKMSRSSTLLLAFLSDITKDRHKNYP